MNPQGDSGQYIVYQALLIMAANCSFARVALGLGIPNCPKGVTRKALCLGHTLFSEEIKGSPPQEKIHAWNLLRGSNWFCTNLSLLKYLEGT